MCPPTERGHGVLDGRIRRDHQDERLGPDLEQAVEQFQAVGAGQLDVAQGHVGLERLDQGQGRGGGPGHADLEPLGLEEFLKRLRDHILIIDHQDAPSGRGRGRVRPAAHDDAPASAGGEGHGSGAVSTGRTTVNVAPSPGSDRQAIEPRSSWTILRLT